ncbi:MAG: phospholipid carrier-dependent glycosyltransferase [Cyanobacteria bacterium P01_A01_bin.116]
MLAAKLKRNHTSHLLAIAAILTAGGFLRVWHLTQFHTFVFDEVYYVKFAQSYLTGQAGFDAHPPLGKYLIATGIWLSHQLSFLRVGLPSAEPLSYRWMNAAVGSLVPLVVIGIAGVLTGRDRPQPEQNTPHSSRKQHQVFGLLAGTFIAIDGLFITESRYALINIYMVFFGLLGHWFWLQAPITTTSTTNKTLINCSLLRLLAGIALGASVATKWNGLGYWLSLLIWEIWQANKAKGQISQIKPLIQQGALYGLLIPSLTYGLIWWPHLSLTGENFLTVQRALLTFHDQLSAQSHIACSQWYTWPLLVKPFPYWYEESGTVVRTVSNLGNPILWWLSTAAVSVMSIGAIQPRLKPIQLKRIQQHIQQRIQRVKHDGNNTTGSFQRTTAVSSNPVTGYLLISYFSNWLPWVAVSRCTYLYLYMPAAVFAFMVLAWLVSQWLRAHAAGVRTMGWLILGAIALAFIFWLPLSLGLPLSPEQLQNRWWLRSWI